MKKLIIGCCMLFCIGVASAQTDSTRTTTKKPKTETKAKTKQTWSEKTRTTESDLPNDANKKPATGYTTSSGSTPGNTNSGTPTTSPSTATNPTRKID
ncbi:MAG: hypothetical protein EOO50_05735 [Flavobacterium sp.]|uniref:hypothetical protein n=1 Tax=Flavobacterium sp. TaxID=239 RepID=UPI00121287A2|nr:hypothetical protein [Flavobacterium sp.]RZJ67486.1 MAG: hypothetical protein EOO50_05735 [Flavobacterium sp.]